MNTVKKILFVVVSCITIFLAISLFTKKGYEVEKTIVLNVPANEVYNYIKFLKNQNHYNCWQQFDMERKESYQGEDGTIGFSHQWESVDEKLGSATEIVKELVYPTHIHTEITHTKPYSVKSQSEYFIEDHGKWSKLKWRISGTISYPTNFFILFTDLETHIGDKIERSLRNLKNKLEVTKY